MSKQTEHPSYGMLQISRVNGTTTLFRSSLEHHNYIVLKVCRAEVLVGGADDCVLDDEKLIEIIMSETQFARAITSMNVGPGVPVTISAVMGERQPKPPLEDRKSYVIKAHNDRLAQQDDDLTELRERVRAWRDAKRRPSLAELDRLGYDMQIRGTNFRANSDHYRQTFIKDMEAIVDAARAEIETHVAATASRLGMDRLKFPGLAKPKRDCRGCDRGGYDSVDPACNPCQGKKPECRTLEHCVNCIGPCVPQESPANFQHCAHCTGPCVPQKPNPCDGCQRGPECHVCEHGGP